MARKWTQKDSEKLAGRIDQAQRLLSPDLIRSVDPTDLVHILEGILRPWGTGKRFFLRRMGDLHVP